MVASFQESRPNGNRKKKKERKRDYERIAGTRTSLAIVFVAVVNVLVLVDGPPNQYFDKRFVKLPNAYSLVRSPLSSLSQTREKLFLGNEKSPSIFTCDNIKNAHISSKV